MPLIIAHSEALAFLQTSIPGFVHPPTFTVVVFQSVCWVPPLAYTVQSHQDAELAPLVLIISIYWFSGSYFSIGSKLGWGGGLLFIGSPNAPTLTNIGGRVDLSGPFPF